jgi:hypothetical protein
MKLLIPLGCTMVFGGLSVFCFMGFAELRAVLSWMFAVLAVISWITFMIQASALSD